MDKDKFAELGSYIDLLIDAICVVDKDGHFQFVSAGGERIFGYKPEEMIGRQMLDLMHPDDREHTMQTVAHIMAGEHKVDFENRYVRKDGSVVHILWSARWSESEQVRVAVARDISRQKRAEATQAALLAISEAAHVAADLPDLYQRLEWIMVEFIPAQGFAIAELIDDEVRLVQVHPDTDRIDELKELSARVVAQKQALLQSLDATAANLLGVPLPADYEMDGALLLQSHPSIGFGQAELDLLGSVSEQVAAAIERKQLQARLRSMAMFDQLTQLPNRHLLQDRIRRALARAHRQGSRLAILYLDLDRFKQINDALGHAAGDEILKQAGRRLLGSVRQSDTVARIGGDEFVVLLEAPDSEATIMAVAEKIRSALNEPFDLQGRRLQTPPSVGVAIFPEHGSADEQLLNNADDAMYEAKKAGGNCVKLSEPPSSG